MKHYLFFILTLVPLYAFSSELVDPGQGFAPCDSIDQLCSDGMESCSRYSFNCGLEYCNPAPIYLECPPSSQLQIWGSIITVGLGYTGLIYNYIKVRKLRAKLSTEGKR